MFSRYFIYLKLDVCYKNSQNTVSIEKIGIYSTMKKKKKKNIEIWRKRTILEFMMRINRKFSVELKKRNLRSKYFAGSTPKPEDLKKL